MAYPPPPLLLYYVELCACGLQTHTGTFCSSLVYLYVAFAEVNRGTCMCGLVCALEQPNSNRWIDLRNELVTELAYTV
jgi:hypothetical protein